MTPAEAHQNSNLSKEALQSLHGVKAKDEATKGYVMQQTMLRVKDPKASLTFYTGALGMTLVERLDFADMAFSLYFLAYVDPSLIPEDRKERARWMFGLPATIELTHNWGTETDPNFKGYHNGNAEPRGFGHIGIAVPDVDAAAGRWAEMGVEFVKKPQDGKMKGIAFIKDPDGYWIEVLNPANADAFADWPGNKS